MRSFFRRPMTPQITDSTELLSQIQRKDTAYRFVQSIFIVLTFGLVLAILYQSLKLQNQNHQLLDSQTKLLQQNADLTKTLQADFEAHKTEDDQQLADLQNHMDCIVSLFTMPNRANLSIANIQTCKLATTPTSSSGSATGTTKSTSVGSTPVPSAQAGTTSNPSPPPKKQSHPGLCKLTFGLLGC